MKLDTMNKEETFKVRAYGYGELAQLYFPNISKKSATWQLRKWIVSDKSLLPELINCGFKKGNRLLTPAHVKLIIEKFGEP
jgi:hypothetical protein